MLEPGAVGQNLSILVVKELFGLSWIDYTTFTFSAA